MATAIDRSDLHGADIVDSILLIPIDQIEVGDRLRAVDPVHAQGLGLAMARDGQKVSIQVCRLPGANRWTLVDGAHRLAGAEMAGIAYLRAEVTSADRDERRLREIWAQLGHKGLQDPIDRAAFVAELVQIKRGRAGLAETALRDSKVKNAIKADAATMMETISITYGWSDEVGEQLGFTGRTIRNDLLIYRGIAPSLIAELRDARHPVARNATQLRALAKLSPERQRLIVNNLVAGARSVIEAMVAKAPRPADPQAKRLSAFIGAFSRMSLPERKGALAELAGVLPAGFALIDAANTKPKPASATVVADEVKRGINDAFSFFLELDKWDHDASIGMVSEHLQKARASIQLACFAVNAGARA